MRRAVEKQAYRIEDCPHLTVPNPEFKYQADCSATSSLDCPTAAAGKVAPHELNGAGGNANAVLSPSPRIIFILGHEYQHILVDERQLDSFLPMRGGE